MIPVSVVIVTKNEEKNIRDALESVKDFDDIVIVDSFSEDRTLDICREYTEKVFQHPWQGYAKQKQMAVDYTEKPWILILDADERVTPELKAEIMEKCTGGTSLSIVYNGGSSRKGESIFTLRTKGKMGGFAGFYIPRKNFFLGRWIRHSGWWPDYTLRLFRKEISYVEQREVHEKVIVKGPVGYLKNPLKHYTYQTISDYIKKMENYSTLAAKEILSKNPQPSAISLIFKMTMSPVFTFFKMFFLKQGFRDGIHGFILAILYSFYTFLKYAKAWEIKRG